MGLLVLYKTFYKAIENDQRISATHISVYMALLHDHAKHRFRNPVFLKKEIIMMKAKINSKVTYNRCMKRLHEFGYIRYQPSYSPGCSQVIILDLS